MDRGTTKTGPYDAAFGQHLKNFRMFPDDDDDARYPSNLDAIRTRLTQAVSSFTDETFSEANFREFRRLNRNASNEAAVKDRVWPRFRGDPSSSRIMMEVNREFTNLKDLTDGTISRLRPDYYEGSRPRDLHERVQAGLGPYLQPSKAADTAWVPNMFSEIKGKGDSLDVARLAAQHAGIAGARGCHKLREFADADTAFDDNARTLSTTYESTNGCLVIYVHHVTPSEEADKFDMDHYMTQVDGYMLLKNRQEWKAGAIAFHNAREWAFEQREELIRGANGKVHSAAARRSDTTAPMGEASLA